MTLPATIRAKNPGAQYPGRASKKFGSAAFERIGGGHKIAIFPSSIHGAAALFYLLATSKHYNGKPISEAIATWSGGNHVNAYLSAIEKKTSLSRGDFIDSDIIDDPDTFISLARAMAAHETGYAYPMSSTDWRDAYAMFKAATEGAKIEEREKGAPVESALEWALDHLGHREIPGPEHNPFVVQCFTDVGRPEIQDDETAWCAAFLGAALKNSGCAYLPGALTARSYLDYGVQLAEPEVGALCVLWRVRPNSWQGHVAFVESWTATTVTLVGGNQNDSVSRIKIPRTGPKSQVLGYRRAVPALTPARDVLSSDSVQYKLGGIFAVVMSMLYSAWENFAAGFAMLWAMLSGFWTDAPELASEVSSQVTAFQQLSVLSGLPWPVYVSAGIALIAIGSNLYGTWNRKRHRQDADTFPVNVQVDVRAG